MCNAIRLFALAHSLPPPARALVTALTDWRGSGDGLAVLRDFDPALSAQGPGRAKTIFDRIWCNINASMRPGTHLKFTRAARSILLLPASNFISSFHTGWTPSRHWPAYFAVLHNTVLSMLGCGIRDIACRG